LNDASTPARANSFTEVAPYYDELMAGVPYPMWVAYYLLLLARLGAKPKRLLDVACGTGTMCEMLAGEGYEMAGFDLSPGMIERARRKAAKAKLPIRYEVGDAADFDMGETYEGALSFFDSLNNILEPERLRMAFARVFAHLEPGGTFIFDLNTAYAFEAKLFDQKNLRKNAKLRYDWHGDWDPATRLIEVTMDFWYQGEPFREIHVQRAYDYAEVVEMLEEVGFTDVQAFHSYTLNPPRFKSDRIHYCAVRP